jgi:hypothetical protein
MHRKEWGATVAWTILLFILKMVFSVSTCAGDAPEQGFSVLKYDLQL